MLVLGLLVFILGLWIALLPANFLKVAHSLSKWVSTEEYFNALDKPRYQENTIYKYHRITGSLISVGAIYTFVKLITDISSQSFKLPFIIDTVWSEWFYSAMYYFLIIGNLLAMVIGIIMIIRPSLLKSLEKILNGWIATDQKLKKLDQQYNIALPGNPRFFGLAIVLAGLYIMLSMGVMSF